MLRQKTQSFVQKRRDEYEALADTELPRGVAEMVRLSVDEGCRLTVTEQTRAFYDVERKIEPTEWADKSTYLIE